MRSRRFPRLRVWPCLVALFGGAVLAFEIYVMSAGLVSWPPFTVAVTSVCVVLAVHFTARALVREVHGRPAGSTEDDLTQMLTELADLLRAHGFPYRAEWIDERRNCISTQPQFVSEIKLELVRAATAGMGGLNDLQLPRSRTVAGASVEIPVVTPRRAAIALLEHLEATEGSTDVYAYDPAGHRVGHTHTGETSFEQVAAYDPASQLRQTATSGDVAGSASFGHDRAGNRTSQVVGGVGTSFGCVPQESRLRVGERLDAEKGWLD